LRDEAARPGRFAAAAAAVLALALLAGCARQNASAQERRGPPPPTVEVAPVVQKDVPVYGKWVGTLQGYVNAHIQPHVSGYLIRQDYHEGGLVRKGQVLFEIDPRPFQAVLDQAKAQVAEAKAQLAKATLDVQRDIPEAKARAIPQSQLDNDRQAQLAAKAAVEAGEAAVETASLNLGYTKVRSLIDGIAGIAQTQVGNLVGPNTLLTSVSQVNPIKVYFPISEQEYLRIAGRIVPGGVDLLSRTSPIALHLVLSDGSTYPYRGRVLFADRQVDQQTGTIRLVGSFPNPRDLLRPGQYARVRALTEILKGALLVPQRAVTQMQGTYEVAVVGKGNRIQIRAVEVGQTVGPLWVITKGLYPGERVVAEGAQKVRDGEQVKPAPYKPAGDR
jgi:RND family efflux transporter MFP subunit